MRELRTRGGEGAHHGERAELDGGVLALVGDAAALLGGERGRELLHERRRRVARERAELEGFTREAANAGKQPTGVRRSQGEQCAIVTGSMSSPRKVGGLAPQNQLPRPPARSAQFRAAMCSAAFARGVCVSCFRLGVNFFFLFFSSDQVAVSGGGNTAGIIAALPFPHPHPLSLEL